jgi:hypothetical protein
VCDTVQPSIRILRVYTIHQKALITPIGNFAQDLAKRKICCVMSFTALIGMTSLSADNGYVHTSLSIR